MGSGCHLVYIKLIFVYFIDEIETLDGKSRNMKMRNLNNNNCDGNSSIAANVIVENEEESEDVYSKVFEGPPDKASFQPNFIPKPAVRRKKRKGQDGIHKSSNCPPSHLNPTLRQGD